jgi:hypothetical protein
MNSSTKTAPMRLNRLSSTYWRVKFDNPPLNLMGPEFVLQGFHEPGDAENRLGFYVGQLGR